MSRPLSTICAAARLFVRLALSVQSPIERMGPVTMMYETVRDTLHPEDWRVEAVDIDSDGEVYVAIFTGPDAKLRAEEYAAWKSTR
jgi:hypothetical protein